VQVKGHIDIALADLCSPDVTGPAGAAAHRAMRTRGYKLLAETCMDKEPPDVRAALSAFQSAVPELPPLQLCARKAPGTTVAGNGTLDGTLPSTVSEELMQARPGPCSHLWRVCSSRTADAALCTNRAA
jgi:hypothetical protein